MDFSLYIGCGIAPNHAVTPDQSFLANVNVIYILFPPNKVRKIQGGGGPQ